MTEPRIYVASLSDYNAGNLHGRWIDANQTAEEITAEVEEMLSESHEVTAEEWAIHDYEGFESFKLSEWETFENVAAMAAGLAEHGPAFAAYVDNQGGMEYADGFEDSYCGEYASVEEFVDELIDEGVFGGDVSKVADEHPGWIDVESIARDLVLGGDIWTADTDGGRGCFVFWSN